jgi:uncharacterized protein
MAITFDPDKDARNQRKHGIGLARFAEMEWRVAIDSPRRGERRRVVFGLIDGSLHAAVIVRRDVDVRVISLRRASRRERKVYDHG